MKEVRFYFTGTEYIAQYVDDEFDFESLREDIDCRPFTHHIYKDKFNGTPLIIHLDKVLMVAYLEVAPKVETEKSNKE